MCDAHMKTDLRHLADYATISSDSLVHTPSIKTRRKDLC